MTNDSKNRFTVYGAPSDDTSGATPGSPQATEEQLQAIIDGLHSNKRPRGATRGRSSAYWNPAAAEFADKMTTEPDLQVLKTWLREGKVLGGLYLRHYRARVVQLYGALGKHLNEKIFEVLDV